MPSLCCQDLPAISGLLAHHGIIFHCDAAQAPCAMDVSRLAESADLISLSGHKVYGPQGIGALYIRRDLQPAIEPVIYGGGRQNGLRSGTVPVPLCAGMAAAVEIVLAEGLDERRLLGVATPEQRQLRFDGFDAQDILEVWPESHLPGFALRQTDVLQSIMG